MIAEKWEQIKGLFESALDHSPEERPFFLSRVAQQDQSVAHQVGELLSSFEKAGDFLLQPCCVASDFLEELEEEQQRFYPNDFLCGRFRIVHLIGRGGMGEVYKAWDEELEDHVALKVLRLEISAHEFFTSRFRREIQLARKVTHPNVCRIFDSFKHSAGDGTYISVLSMELLQGQNLADYLKSKGRLTAAEAFPIVQQIIAGLGAIHSAGIVHRDLKPGNLVLVPENDSTTVRLKITDFGIAGHLPDGMSQAAQTEVSKLLGTPDYMAPEQLEHGPANIQSDIYSVGLVLYEMVTAVKPFAGSSAWKRISVDPPPPRKLATDLPQNWNTSISCCLERNPKYRFQNTQAVIDSLKDDSSSAKIPPKPIFVRLNRTARSRAGSVAIFFLLAMSLLAGGYRLYRWKAPDGRVLQGSMLFLTNITNDTHDPEMNGVTDLLRGQLSQSAYINLLDEQSIRETFKRMARPESAFVNSNTAREIAMRNGAPLVIFGTVSRNAEAYKLDLFLEKVGNEPERPMASWQFSESTNSKEKVFEIIHHGALWIRRAIGEADTDIDAKNRKPEDVTTDSWEALELYSQGQQMASQDRLEEAALLFKQAKDKDPNFAMAWMSAGDVLDTLGKIDEGLHYWKKAVEVAGVRRLSRREELRIKGMYANDIGDLKSALEFFAQYSIAFPADYLGYFNRGYPLMLMGKPEEAIQILKEAEKRNPYSYYIIDHLARYNLIIGDFAESTRYTIRLRQMGHSGYADQIDGEANVLEKNYTRALELFSSLRASSDPYLKSVSYYLEAATYAEQGHYALAIKKLTTGIAADRQSGDSSDRADKLLALAYLYLRTGNLTAVRDAALTSLDDAAAPRRMANAGMLLARSGWLADAKAVLNRMPMDHSRPVLEVNYLRLHGSILLAERENQKALFILTKAKDKEQEKTNMNDLWARALLAAGRKQEALKEFDILGHNHGQIWSQAEIYPPGVFADFRFESAKIASQMTQFDAQDRLAEYIHMREYGDKDLPDLGTAWQLLLQRKANFDSKHSKLREENHDQNKSVH